MSVQGLWWRLPVAWAVVGDDCFVKQQLQSVLSQNGACMGRKRYADVDEPVTAWKHKLA